MKWYLNPNITYKVILCITLFNWLVIVFTGPRLRVWWHMWCYLTGRNKTSNCCYILNNGWIWNGWYNFELMTGSIARCKFFFASCKDWIAGHNSCISFIFRDFASIELIKNDIFLFAGDDWSLRLSFDFATEKI